MCVVIKRESANYIFLEANTIFGDEIAINKSEVEKHAKQLILTAFGMLEICHDESKGVDYEHAMGLLNDAKHSLDD